MMKYLFKEWERLKKALSNKEIAIFLDYDGTLTPIADKPQHALLSGRIKRLLEGLSRNRRFKVALISGRGLGDLQAIVGIKGLIYAGNHGLEIEGPGIKHRSQASPKIKSVIHLLKKGLEASLSGVEGLILEDKGLTLSVHYRLVEEKEIPRLKKVFEQLTEPYLKRKKLRITRGKKVIEVRPAIAWDKGKAVLWLLARERFRRRPKNVIPVYIGDDITDEDAFRALRHKGLSIFVGSPPAQSQAKYYLQDTAEVVEFLNRLLVLG